MIREYYEAICNGVDVRANLIALRNALKDEKDPGICISARRRFFRAGFSAGA